MHLTIHEVSKLLSLPVSTLQRWVRQGKIPVYKLESGYFFIERELIKWAQAKGIYLAKNQSPSGEKRLTYNTSLAAAFKKGGVLYGIEGESVSGVLKALVDVAPVDNGIDRDQLFQRLLQREDLSSTGIGQGVAIPHPRTPLKNVPGNPSITTCFLAESIDYGGIDGVPVFVLFLMLSPSSRIHLTILGELSHLLRDSSFIDFLRNEPAEQELFSKVDEMEMKAG